MGVVEDIRSLVASGAVRTSVHASRRLQQKDISYRLLLGSLDAAEILESYPDYWHGPSFLARHVFPDGRIAHAVWGIARDDRTAAVLVTAYWPDRSEWDDEQRTRR